MAEIYLTPEDINASDTREVLAFLNSVQSAERIATRIEIPDELDIGVNLGQRILDARESLGGQYQNLQQLMDVPLIGPERFTELVTEVLNRSALEIISRGQQLIGSYQTLDLAARLRSLQQSISDYEHLNPNRYRIEIKSFDQTPYLGEVIPLRIRVWDRFTRKPSANVPLTIETNWGNLRWNKGLQVKQGSVIYARTSVVGEIDCELYTPSNEPLTVVQQNELSLALAKLPHQADVPNDARESFLQLADYYQHPLNVDLRTAIDIHYKSREHRVAESLNVSTAPFSWHYEHALIRVYAHPKEQEEQQTVLAMSAYTLKFRDWLSPWYQVYKESLIESNSLQAGLTSALNYSNDEKGLVGHMVSSLHSFIAGRNGLIGEKVSQQASKEVLTRMLSSNPETLSANTRASLYTILDQAPRVITASSKGGVGLANEVALDVGRNTGILTAASDLSNVTGLLDELQSSYNGIDSRVDNLEGVTENINFDQLSSDIESFNADYQSFVNDYAVFNTNYTDFNNNYIDFNSNLGNWQSDYSDFQTSLNDFNVAKEQLVTNVTNGVNEALRTLEASNTATTGTRVAINPIENVRVGRNFDGPGGG